MFHGTPTSMAKELFFIIILPFTGSNFFMLKVEAGKKINKTFSISRPVGDGQLAEY